MRWYALMEQQKSVSATYRSTVKVSRGQAGNHVYPTLRLPDSLGDTIGKRVGVYAAGNHCISSPHE